jgi:hypothetical protein
VMMNGRNFSPGMHGPPLFKRSRQVRQMRHEQGHTAT